MAPNVTDWPLSIHGPLPVWHRGKFVLIGDAAHPVRRAPLVPFLVIFFLLFRDTHDGDHADASLRRTRGESGN